jgi:hypothetical protein
MTTAGVATRVGATRVGVIARAGVTVAVDLFGAVGVGVHVAVGAVVGSAAVGARLSKVAGMVIGGGRVRRRTGAVRAGVSTTRTGVLARDVLRASIPESTVIVKRSKSSERPPVEKSITEPPEGRMGGCFCKRRSKAA